jgi:hypothetical protein
MKTPAFDFYRAAQNVASVTKSARVIRFFPEADLRCMHDGLRRLALEHKIDVLNLKPGEFIVFANRSKTMLKIFAPGNTIAVTKSPDGRRLDLNVIRLIPRFFNGSEFQYDKALQKLLENKTQVAA